MRFLNIRWCVLIIGLILVTACTNEAETDEDISALEQEQLEEQQVEQQIEQVDALDVAQREQQDQRGEQNQQQEQESSTQPKERVDEIDYVFPESVELTFQEVELVTLEPSEPTASWELVHSISLGKIEDEQVELEVYQVSDSDAPCSSYHEAAGMLVYQGQSYGLRDCLSYSFLHEDSDRSHDVIELGERVVDGILGMDVILQGAVALTANGPGRMGYLYYDQLQDNWSMFIDWGMPVITDLDEDGQRELVIQFQGLHLSWPDVAIYRWHEGTFEASDSLKVQLDIPSMSFNEAVLIEQDKQIMINMFVHEHEELEETISAKYTYQDGMLIKQDE